MKTISKIYRAVLALPLLLALSSAHSAGLIEQILANPRVQAFLGTPAVMGNTLGQCKLESYRVSNVQLCADATNAANMLKLPIEMRTVMGNPISAQSLRELCLLAQSTAKSNSYLCAELAKSDTTFGANLAEERNRIMQELNRP